MKISDSGKSALLGVYAAMALVALTGLKSTFAANILWVTDFFTDNSFSPPGSDVNDTNFIVLLQNAGHNVYRFNSPNSSTTALTDEQITAINTNDLIIIGRATASGAFANVQGGQWNTNITKPLMLMSSYLARRDNLGWFIDQTVPDVAGTTLTNINLDDPDVAYIFQNVTMIGTGTADPFDEPIDRNLSTISVAPVSGGVVIASARVNGATVIAEFPQGTVVKAGTQPLAGYRMLFCGGSREAASPGGVANAGKENLTPTGETIFLNAVEVAANNGLVPSDPTPISITNQPASLTVTEGQPASFAVIASGTPLAFHWLRDGTPIAGANRNFYTIGSTVYPGDNGAQFVVIVSNALGAVTSEVATLTVNVDTTGPSVVSAIGELNPTLATINFSEPLHPGTVSQGSFSVFLTGTNPDDGLLTIDYMLTNDNRTVVITTDARSPGVNYSIRVTGVMDNSSQQNLQTPDPVFLPLRQIIQLIGFDTDNEWKYDINNGDRFGTGWETVGYDDSTWPSGPAGLGLDVSANGVPIRTALPYAADSSPTYFRRHFVLPSATNGVSLSLRHVVEDGAVYYINGQEVFRHRVAAGALTFASRANAGAPDPTPIEGPFTLPTTSLQPGDNVMAVVVLQSGATSSDLELAVELTASIPAFSVGAPTITSHPQPMAVDEGSSVTLTVAADGAQPMTFQWRKNGNDIPGATDSSYTINPARPIDGGSYDVVVTNGEGSATSTAAVLSVVPDTTGPSFLSAIGQTNLSEIVLTFSERLSVDNAEDVGNYNVSFEGGGGALTINSATVTNGTNVVLNTSPRVQGPGYIIVLGNVTDTSDAQNQATPLTLPVAFTQILLAPDEVTLWRFNTASNNLDGLGWPLPGFDDAAWNTGLAGFTTSNNLEVTTNGFELRTTNMIAPVSGGPITAYYRVPFNFPGSPAGASLRLVGVVDDGLVAYINGVEAGRLRVTNASPVSFNHLATASSPESSDVHLPLETIVLTNLSGLVSGNNLLALELHQNSATSSDAVLSVQLLGVIGEGGVSGGPRLHISRNLITGEITVSWSGPGVLQHSSALLSPGTQWTDVPGNPNPYTFMPTGEKRFFRLGE